jgi:hypothetical protein
MRSKTCKAIAETFYKSKAHHVHFNLVTPDTSAMSEDPAEALLFGSSRPESPSDALLARATAAMSPQERARFISSLSATKLRAEENSMDQGDDDNEEDAPRATAAKTTKKKSKK